MSLASQVSQTWLASRSRAAETRDVGLPDDVARFHEMPQQIWPVMCDSNTFACETERRVLHPEQVRLQSCLDDVEWTSHDRTAHGSQSSDIGQAS